MRGLALGMASQATNEAKYLDVIMDSKLNWKRYLDDKCSKVVQAFWAGRRAFCMTRELAPDKIRWLYTSVLRSRLRQVAVVWGRQCERKGAKAALDRVQSIVLTGIVGCISITPLAAMEYLTVSRCLSWS